MILASIVLQCRTILVFLQTAKYMDNTGFRIIQALIHDKKERLHLFTSLILEIKRWLGLIEHTASGLGSLGTPGKSKTISHKDKILVRVVGGPSTYTYIHTYIYF